MIQHFCEKANIMIKTKSSLVVYQSKNGALELKTDSQYNTIWLTQEQLASLFDVQRQAISKHLGNIFSSGELNENSVCSKMEHTAKDGKTYKAIYFNSAEYTQSLAMGDLLEVAYNLKRNDYNGKTYVDLIVRDLHKG